MGSTSEQDPRVYLAAERTFLAWIRTGLGRWALSPNLPREGGFISEETAHHGAILPVA